MWVCSFALDICQDDEIEHLYLIGSGTCGLVSTSVLMGQLKSGQVFPDEETVCEHKKSAFEVIAMSSICLVKIPIRIVKELHHLHPTANFLVRQTSTDQSSNSPPRIHKQPHTKKLTDVQYAKDKQQTIKDTSSPVTRQDRDDPTSSRGPETFAKRETAENDSERREKQGLLSLSDLPGDPLVRVSQPADGNRSLDKPAGASKPCSSNDSMSETLPLDETDRLRVLEQRTRTRSLTLVGEKKQSVSSLSELLGTTLTLAGNQVEVPKPDERIMEIWKFLASLGIDNEGEEVLTLRDHTSSSCAGVSCTCDTR